MSVENLASISLQLLLKFAGMSALENLASICLQLLFNAGRNLNYLYQAIHRTEAMAGSVNYGIETCLHILLMLCVSKAVDSQTNPAKPMVSAFYIFGDSTVDSGNNNVLIGTLAKANYPPYGRDFPDHKPTGRFANGKLVTDVLSGLSGLPVFLPAYLDTQFRGPQILTGASFASALSGYYEPASLAFNVLPLRKQVENFRHYRVELVNMVGSENASKMISEGLFGISTGTIDFVNVYYLDHLMRQKYTPVQFQDLLLKYLLEFIQNIYNEGAIKLFVIGVPPIGCLPSQITLHNLIGDTCVEEYNDVAVSFNNRTASFLETMKPRFPGLRMDYIDIYDRLFDMIQNPSIYGFEEARKGCCGTGLLEVDFLCNAKSPSCPDASKYVFWDSFHASTQAYTILAQDIQSHLFSF